MLRVLIGLFVLGDHTMPAKAGSISAFPAGVEGSAVRVDRIGSELPAAQTSVRAQFTDSAKPLIVVAHRGCHNPAPQHGFAQSAPENSAEALERCIVIGADVMETDVRRTKDGYLVIIHDATVDRTTDGKGRVSDLTLTQFKRLRLRKNEGGDADVTAAAPLTLDEILTQARGRLILNLDVKEAVYGEVVEAVKQAGQADGVIVKTLAGVGSPALAAIPPFDAVPFVPILTSQGDNRDLAAIAAAQTVGREPVALELPSLVSVDLPAVVRVARQAGVRLWLNSLFEGFVRDFGGDAVARRNPDAVWGRMMRSGISVIQTDEPEALLAFIKRPGSNERLELQ